MKGVHIVTEVIEDYAYVRYRDADMVVKMKGVSDNFLDQHRLDNHLEDGRIDSTKRRCNVCHYGARCALCIVCKHR
ncbi:MAG: hypothetical protein U5K54_17045 [Cytophagales bacterium]|nr:hypothetical protein [Cytophagales bacterium]